MLLFIFSITVVANKLEGPKPILPGHTEPATVVQQSNGMYIFIQCLPVMPYDSLGMVEDNNVQLTPNINKYMVNAIIRNAKRQYPAADGLIFTDINLTRAKVIEFK